MKQMFALVLLVGVLIGCSPQDRENTNLTPSETDNAAVEETREIEPTSEEIDAVEREMAEWAEGRWTAFSAEWSPGSRISILSATADPSANETAIKGYCRIMNDIAQKHLQGVKVSAAVFLQSGSKIECKVNDVT